MARGVKRTQRALDRATRFIERLDELRRRATHDDRALEELESLVLVARGSAETDHRQQLALGGLQASFERYLVDGAPGAADYAASSDPDALLADEALRELRDEYPEDAMRMDVAGVASAVRTWATGGRGTSR